MTEVYLKRVYDCLSEEDKVTVNQLIESAEVVQGGEFNSLYINSNITCRDNKIIAGNNLVVTELDVLAILLKNNIETWKTDYGIIRPDVLKYITSTRIDVNNRPITPAYKVELPNLIQLWNKVEV